uniref:Thioredoxin domain-containing protein n=1 Tax=Thalassionema nitzschioides TaxID=33649 RepID=A0A7S1H524_9STRA
MKFTTAILSLLAVSATAIELTPDNWDSETAGKVVFVKMFAPWCGHCKKMKPDWDKLMEDNKDSTTQLIADVDCTTDGKPLCDSNGVRGFPTLKYGDPSDLQDYNGGRDYDSLAKFIKEELKPVCSPANIDLCDDEKKAEIEKLEKMSDADLDAAIAAEEKKVEDAESKFKEEVEKLQETYQKLQQDNEAAQEAVKAAGLGLMKSVKAAKAAASKGSDEL